MGRPYCGKEYPLIDAAAEAGCEYFCIDAGWYSAGIWWDNVGEWQESRERFPEGMKKVTDYIRSKGLIPGVWLEIEVMGINCPKAKNVPDDWFFMRHGKRYMTAHAISWISEIPRLSLMPTRLSTGWFVTTAWDISRWTTT